MYTLGINAAFHDSAATLVEDGKLIAAAEEERFTHIKHGKRPTPFSAYELPYHAIDYCLKEAGIHLNDLEHIAYSFDPFPLIKHRLGHHSHSSKESQKNEIRLPLEPSSHPLPPGWDSVCDPLFLAHIVN